MTYFTAPVRVSLDLTYTCDLRCIHCRTNTGEIPASLMRKMMKFDQIVKVIHDLDKMEVLEITLTGGEPTIHSRFWEIVEVINDLKYSQITLITNAATLDHDKIDRLAENNIQSVRVSIDGTRDTFLKIRKKDVFDKVIENCRYLQERVENFKILTTVMTTNLDNYLELAHYLHENGFKRQDLILVRAHGRGMRNNLTLSEQQVQKVLQEVGDFQNQVHTSEFDLNLNAPYLVPEPENRLVHDVVMYPYIARDASLAISATGDVTMSRLYSPHPIGNVKLEGIKDIWDKGQQDLEAEQADFDEDTLRDIFWAFDEKPEFSALLDRQIFENIDSQ